MDLGEATEGSVARKPQLYEVDETMFSPFLRMELTIAADCISELAMPLSLYCVSVLFPKSHSQWVDGRFLIPVFL